MLIATLKKEKKHVKLFVFLCLLIQIVPYFSVKIIENASEQRRKRFKNEEIKIVKFLV